jgi:hypothetical protein
LERKSGGTKGGDHAVGYPNDVGDEEEAFAAQYLSLIFRECAAAGRFAADVEGCFDWTRATRAGMLRERRTESGEVRLSVPGGGTTAPFPDKESEAPAGY